jgi:hypothetical protein
VLRRWRIAIVLAVLLLGFVVPTVAYAATTWLDIYCCYCMLHYPTQPEQDLLVYWYDVDGDGIYEPSQGDYVIRELCDTVCQPYC